MHCYINILIVADDFNFLKKNYKKLCILLINIAPTVSHLRSGL